MQMHWFLSVLIFPVCVVALCGNNSFALPVKNGSTVIYQSQWPQIWCLNVDNLDHSADTFALVVDKFKVQDNETLYFVGSQMGKLSEDLDIWATADYAFPIAEQDGICVMVTALRDQDIHEFWSSLAFGNDHLYGNVYEIALTLQVNLPACGFANAQRVVHSFTV
jgi:hypothetical protein